MAEHDHDTHDGRLQSPHLDEELRTDELVRTAFTSREHNDDGLRGDGTVWRGPGNRGGRRRSLPKGIKWAVVGLVIIFIGGFGISYYVARHVFIAAMSTRAEQLQQGIHALKDFNLNAAAQQFAAAGSNGTGVESVLGPLSSLFSGGTNVVSVFGDISQQLSLLTQDLSNVQGDAWGMLAHVPIVNGASAAGSSADASSSLSSPSAPSSTLITDLQGIQSALAAIDADSAKLVNIASSLRINIPGGGLGLASGIGNGGGVVGSYLSLSAGLHATETFLNAFIPWLADASTTHHVLVLLENPSEMRPGGGFLGSYADVSLRGGAITGIAVHDIASVDAAFTKKIVPPVPLQLEENGWRPADGNWFFDFPTSASATIALFEQSGMYAGTVRSGAGSGTASTTFDGVIALTPQAMADILSVVGPITVPDASLGVAVSRGAATSTTFTADNLIPEIQNIVQEGQARRGSAPKSVIGVLWKDAFARLASANATQRQDLMTLAASWIANKDVMAYFKNPAIENFIVASGMGGEAFHFPSDFNGDYLAVANTDVNSDKSELYVSSTVAWTVQIGSRGTATDQVVVTRTHHGNAAPAGEWWYRTTNQDWLQVFVPGGSSLTNETGGFVKRVPPPVNYARGGWSTNPLIYAMQSSTAPIFAYPAVSVRNGNAGGADPGKTVYAVWDRTYAGRTTQVTFDYTHPLYTPPADGVQYEFVLERPSGAVGDYKIQVDAPLGYVFAENGLATWTYDSTSTPGRLVVDLTLQKL